jgi:hypothetical protein
MRDTMPEPLNSHAITQGPSRAPARAMLKAIGLTDDDLRKPLIGIANTWTEIGPCNYHLRELAEHVKSRHPGRWWHPARVQHRQHFRWHHYGCRGDEDLPHQPGSDC